MCPAAKISFGSDYMEGAHPAILKRLADENFTQFAGYGTDTASEAARNKIRAACQAPEADVYFLVGGTQVNSTIISALLKSYQGVLAAETGHINTHESGAVEASGHRVMALPQREGKLSAQTIRTALEAYDNDAKKDHCVMPGMVYISHPTESGTLYSLAELEAISAVCRAHKVPLYVDGARMSYALASSANDVTLPDLARLCDVFYIGGTKCGALFGEAVVIPKHGLIPHFFSIIKQRGALLAKGFVAGLEFDTLFTDGLYASIGRTAVEAADRIRAALEEAGYPQAYPTHANQIFPVMTREQIQRISEEAELGHWEDLPDGRSIMRITTSWATKESSVDRLIALLKEA